LNQKPTYEELEQRIQELESQSASGDRFRGELLARVKELTAINMLAKEVTSSLSLNQVMSSIYKMILSLTRADLVIVYLLKEDKLILPSVRPNKPKIGHDAPEIKRMGECLCGLVASEGKPVYSKEIHNDPRCTLEECKKAGIKSFAALPFLVDSEVLGVLGVGSCIERDFQKQANFLETLASQAAIGLKNANLHDQIKRYSNQVDDELKKSKLAREQLEKINTRLERMVQERTDELAKTKKQLEKEIKEY